MNYDNNLLWMELAALAVVVGFGIWRMYLAHRKAGGDADPRLPAVRAYDMRRDGQRLSAD